MTHNGFSPTPSVALYRSIAASRRAGVKAPIGRVRSRNTESLLRSRTGDVKSVSTQGKTGYCVTSGYQHATMSILRVDIPFGVRLACWLSSCRYANYPSAKSIA